MINRQCTFHLSINNIHMIRIYMFLNFNWMYQNLNNFHSYHIDIYKHQSNSYMGKQIDIANLLFVNKREQINIYFIMYSKYNDYFHMHNFHILHLHNLSKFNICCLYIYIYHLFLNNNLFNPVLSMIFLFVLWINKFLLNYYKCNHV